jgi:hypothetical protein
MRGAGQEVDLDLDFNKTCEICIFDSGCIEIYYGMVEEIDLDLGWFLML